MPVVDGVRLRPPVREVGGAHAAVGRMTSGAVTRNARSMTVACTRGIGYRRSSAAESCERAGGGVPLVAGAQRRACLMMTLGTAGADSLVPRYDEIRAETERLAAPLSPEDQTVQSMPDVSPTKWHRAHVTWFFETFLRRVRAGVRPVPGHVLVPVQQLLRGARSAILAPAPWSHQPAGGARRGRVPEQRGRPPARPPRYGRRGFPG